MAAKKHQIETRAPMCTTYAATNDVEPATAAGRSEYQGETYYFCGAACKEKFDLNPEQYLGESADTPKGGCCS